VKRNLIRRIARSVALVAITVGSFWELPECEAQKKLAPAEYDYYALALTSISNSARDASKVPDMPQRVNLLLLAAKVLAPSQRDEAMRLLDIALDALKTWAPQDKPSWYQQHTTATLRNEVLSVYAILDSQKAIVLQKDFQGEAESIGGNTSVTSLQSDTWFTHFSNRRTPADQAAKIALSLVENDPDRAFALVLQSLQDGVVSGVLAQVLQKLVQSGNRSALNKLEVGIGQVLAVNVTLDPFSLASASLLVSTDKDMPAAARSAFLSFLMRSLQACSNLVRNPSGNGRVDSSYITAVFTMVSLNVRPLVVRYASEQLLMFDLVLDQVAAFVPSETRSRLQAFQPETFSDPRDRLSDILKDAAPARRDLRLVRLIADLMGKNAGDLQKNLDLASDAISGFSDTDVKSAYTDLLTITRIDGFVKQKKFIEAQQLAGSISSEETRAWALLALSMVAVKVDRVLGFELISNALKALDKASPSPHKVELALIATAMLAKSDPQRAFDTLSTVSKYANSSPSTIDPPTKPAVAFGLEAQIGEAHTKLGVFPESLAELKIDPSLSTLATTDWFRAEQIVDGIREPSLRLHLKLQLAGSVLAKQSKPRKM
jgi:hypothetical protein